MAKTAELYFSQLGHLVELIIHILHIWCCVINVLRKQLCCAFNMLGRQSHSKELKSSPLWHHRVTSSETPCFLWTLSSKWSKRKPNHFNSCQFIGIFFFFFNKLWKHTKLLQLSFHVWVNGAKHQGAASTNSIMEAPSLLTHFLEGLMSFIIKAKLRRLLQKTSVFGVTESFCNFAAFSMPTTSLGCYYQQDFGPPA